MLNTTHSKKKMKITSKIEMVDVLDQIRADAVQALVDDGWEPRGSSNVGRQELFRSWGTANVVCLIRDRRRILLGLVDEVLRAAIYLDDQGVHGFEFDLQSSGPRNAHLARSLQGTLDCSIATSTGLALWNSLCDAAGQLIGPDGRLAKPVNRFCVTVQYVDGEDNADTNHFHHDPVWEPHCRFWNAGDAFAAAAGLAEQLSDQKSELRCGGNDAEHDAIQPHAVLVCCRDHCMIELPLTCSPIRLRANNGDVN